MESFTGLPQDKQEKIIDAALSCFGANGYKKASVSDIAARARISKAMVFHYFGTKKGLYLYLVTLVGQFMTDAFTKALPQLLDPKLSDFFDRVRLSTRLKVALMKKHPAFLSFANAMYVEKHPDVRPDVEALMAKGEAFRRQVAFGGIDSHKFKDGIDPEKIMKMLTWMAEGYISEFPANKQYDIDALAAVFDDCLEIMKKNFYKEEYLQ